MGEERREEREGISYDRSWEGNSSCEGEADDVRERGEERRGRGSVFMTGWKGESR